MLGMILYIAGFGTHSFDTLGFHHLLGYRSTRQALEVGFSLIRFDLRELMLPEK